jgi:predicted nucleotidyltransferase component of viral defense system
MTITEGHFARHYQGVRGARDAAMLDIAQDHALYHLSEAGLFGRGLVFKGGTALRKYRAGNAGRFSTDLDFAAPDPDLALDVLNALDGAQVRGFRSSLPATPCPCRQRSAPPWPYPSTRSTTSPSPRCR